MSEKSTRIANIRATRKSIFLILNAKKTFNYLKQAFIKALIFQHFDSECHIQIKIDISAYLICGLLSKLNLDSNAPPNDSNKSDFS